MPNKYVNKVVIGKETKLDLTADTVTPDKLAKGITAHDKSGAPITGTSTKDADTSDATAAVAEVLNGKTFYARGAKMTGTMPNNGEVNGEISTVSGKYTIPMGFHDGAGGVTIAATEQAKLVPTNIREAVSYTHLDVYKRQVGNILKGLPSAIGTFITSAGPQISTAIGQALGSISPDLSGLWTSISGKLGGLWLSLIHI